MQFHILTLFPEMVLGGLNTSIIGRACEKGLLSINAVNIRDFTENKHNKVDDYPYGGGAGMLMQAQPVFDAYASVAAKSKSGKRMRVIYVTPQGKVFDQAMAREFAREEELVFLCGHYEGIDERVLEEIVTDYVSIGDYVLTGGELPAMVMADAISRMVPGVLKNEESGEFESFHENLLEYPQYTRPEVWHEKSVPAVLLSGDHAKVDKWRTERSVERTKKRRPDLYAQYDLTGRALDYLKQDKLLHMDMIESIRRGLGKVIGLREDGVLLQDKNSGVYLVTAADKDAGERLLSLIEPEKVTDSVFSCHQQFLTDSITARFGKTNRDACYQAVYTRKSPLPENPAVRICPLEESDAAQIAAHYHLLHDEAYIRERLRAGMIFGAFAAGTLAGFAGVHAEGGMGMLEVFPQYRRQGIGEALERFVINRTLERKQTPYAHIFADNEASVCLQKKLGLKIPARKIYWIR